MPRGAIPSPRSEIAAAQPYRSETGADVVVPSGELASPNYELAAAQPYQAGAAAPESFLAWPIEIGFWGNDRESNSSWAEEAFAKACAEPRVSIPVEAVLQASRERGTSSFAAFMQTHGFPVEGRAYLDGPFYSVEWTNEAALNGAIASAGPVKIGVASAPLTSGSQGRVTPGRSGWALWGIPESQPEDHWASLFGYGPLAVLVDQFERHGVLVEAPPGMPTRRCYAMFTWGSVGIIDWQSLMNIASEAWVRNPTTIVKEQSG